VYTIPARALCASMRASAGGLAGDWSGASRVETRETVAVSPQSLCATRSTISLPSRGMCQPYPVPHAVDSIRLRPPPTAQQIRSAQSNLSI